MNQANQDKPTVLVVDDEFLSGRNIELTLARQGYQVIRLEDPRQVLPMLRDNPHVSLVLTDFNMPDMNGVQVAQAVKAEFPNMPMMLITARPQSYVVGQLPDSADFSGLFDGYFQKGGSEPTATLITTAQQLINQREAGIA